MQRSIPTMIAFLFIVLFLFFSLTHVVSEAKQNCRESGGKFAIMENGHVKCVKYIK